MEIGADDWIRPRDALKILCEFFTEYAATETILKCLRGDQIKSVAMTSSMEIKNKLPQRGNPVSLISAKLWPKYPPATEWNHFWQTGVISFPLNDFPAYPTAETLTCFDVRFDPIGIHALLPPITPPDAPKPQPSEAKQGERKAVSEAHLKDWLILFTNIYGEDGITLEKAWASAKGMFPDKFVSRNAVDKILPQRSKGRRKWHSGN